jgi:hypothetical protein
VGHIIDHSPVVGTANFEQLPCRNTKCANIALNAMNNFAFYKFKDSMGELLKPKAKFLTFIAIAHFTTTIIAGLYWVAVSLQYEGHDGGTVPVAKEEIISKQIVKCLVYPWNSQHNLNIWKETGMPTFAWLPTMMILNSLTWVVAIGLLWFALEKTIFKIIRNR